MSQIMVDKSTEWLEDFQREEYAKLGLQPEQYTAEQIRDALANFPLVDKLSLKRLDDARDLMLAGKLGSRYDPPELRAGWHITSARIEHLYSVNSIPFSRPLLGEWPGFLPNAMLRYVPQISNHVVLFQRGIFTYLNASLMVLAAIYPYDDDWCRMSKNCRSAADSKERFERGFGPFAGLVLAALIGKPELANELVLEALKGGGYSNDNQILLTANQMKQGLALCDYCNTFVLAHEYGHLLDDQGKAGLKSTFYGSPAEQESMKTYAREFHADFHAAGVALRIGKHFSPGIAWSGVWLFFSLMRLLETASEILLTGEESNPDELDSLSHPPLIARQKACEPRLDDDYSHEESEEADRMRRIFNFLIEEYASNVRGLFKFMHDCGVQTYLLPEYRTPRPTTPRNTLKVTLGI